MLLNLAFLLFWPILQGSPQYIELSKFWNRAQTIETGLTRQMAVLACPSRDTTTAGWLVAVDSSGKLVELRCDNGAWTNVRSFSAGTPLVAIFSAAPLPDLEFRLYAGTKSGQVLEISRGTMGWSKREIIQLPAPVKALSACEAGAGGIVSVLMAIDGNGQVSELVPPSAGAAAGWNKKILPDIPGGATHVVSHRYGEKLWAAAAGPKGIVYRYALDSLGSWHGEPWATMAAGVKFLAQSSDPSARDIAVFYEGTDGLFRYLFFNYTDDKKARVPVADGITHIIGGGNQRRFNEFFGVSGDEFCMFEFDFEDKAWHKVPIEKIDRPVVSSVFGFGFNTPVAQMYVASANGKVHEFVRYNN